MSKFEIKRPRIQNNAVGAGSRQMGLSLVLETHSTSIGSCSTVAKSENTPTMFYWVGNATLEMITQDGQSEQVQFEYVGALFNEDGSVKQIKPETSSVDVARKLTALLQSKLELGYSFAPQYFPPKPETTPEQQAPASEQQPGSEPASEPASEQAPVEPETKQQRRGRDRDRQLV